MSIKEIQDNIKSSKVKIKRYKDSQKLRRTQVWKSVVLEGLEGDFLNQALKDMSHKDPDIRARAKLRVVGVGVLRSYLESLEESSHIAELAIQAAESELTMIRG